MTRRIPLAVVMLVVGCAPSGNPFPEGAAVASRSYAVVLPDPLPSGTSFGAAVAGSCDVDGDGYGDLVVGAPTQPTSAGVTGKFWLIPGSPDGLVPSTWLDDAFGSQDEEGYGSAVAAPGDVNGDGLCDVLVGAPGHDGLEVDEGAAFLFTGSATGLTGPAWSAFGGAPGAGLGTSLAGAGDVNADGFADVLVGAPGWTGTDTEQGAAWLYLGSPTGLEPVPVWTAVGDGPGASLGAQVAGIGDIDGDGDDDWAVVSPGWGPAMGRVEVFEGGGGPFPVVPLWSRDGTAEAPLTGAAFAGDVSGGGAATLALAYADGAVELYQSPLGAEPAWSLAVETQVGTAAQLAVADLNGDGRTDLVVGSPGASDGAGAIAQVLGRSSVAAMDVDVEAVAGESLDEQLGWSLTVGDFNGDGRADLAAGTALEVGRVVVVPGEASMPSAEPDLVIESNMSGAELAWAVENVGDVNGDGIDDLALGAPGMTGPSGQEAGGVWVHHGSALGLPGVPDWEAYPTPPAGGSFGFALAGGDVDGDGFDDLLVGAKHDSRGAPSGGAAAWYSGGPGGLAGGPGWEVVGTALGGLLGTAVGTAGDTDADGYPEVVALAMLYADPEPSEGLAFLYPGSAVGPALNATWDWGPDTEGAWLQNGSGGGDTDGDGLAEFILGTPQLEANHGGVWLFVAGPGESPVQAWESIGPTPGSGYGMSVEPAGDFDGDGWSDLAFGASVTNWDYGAILVHSGTVAGPSAASTAYLTAPNDRRLGQRIAVGDVNGDGLADLVSTLDEWDGSGSGTLFLGSPDGLRADVAWSAPQEPQLGVDCAVGDWNGDGYDDVAIGSAWYTNGEALEGAAWIFDGGGTDGASSPWRPALQLLQPGTTTPIRPWTRSNAADAVDIRLTARLPHGRARLRVDVEVKPLGLPFDATGLTSSPWTDAAIGGPGGLDVTVPITGLAPQTSHHVRARVIADPAHGRAAGASPWLYAGLPGAPQGTHFVTACVSDTDGDRLCDGIDPDGDDDGYDDIDDCEPFDATAYPGGVEVPDDGIDQDCSGADLVTCWTDIDCDGFGAAPPVLDDDGDCADAGQALADDDCDDEDDGISPANDDVPDDGIDQDCNGIDALTCPLDIDNDGWGGAEVAVDLDGDCDDDPGQAGQAGDCDEDDATVYPGAPEQCDQQDDDCNGIVDDGAYLDGDGDGEGRSGCGGQDCDDDDPTVHTGAAEVCNDVDDDCDGVRDDGLAEFDVWRDVDEDGFGDPDRVTRDVCTVPDGWSADGDDCDDGDPSIHPAAPEVCGDGIDQDCDGLGDDRCGGCSCGASVARGTAPAWLLLLLVMVVRRRPAVEATSSSTPPGAGAQS